MALRHLEWRPEQLTLMVPSAMVLEEKAGASFLWPVPRTLALCSGKAVFLSLDTVVPSMDSLCHISISTSSKHFVYVYICMWYACVCWQTCLCIHTCVDAHRLIFGIYFHHYPSQFNRAGFCHWAWSSPIQLVWLVACPKDPLSLPLESWG